MLFDSHTFVIPAYGKSVYLEACILSLLKQTISSSIILSTSTPSVFLKHLAVKYNLTYAINPGPSGIANDWNFALSRASTPLVTIAHQDDVYEPNYTDTVMREMNKHREDAVLIAFTGYQDLVGDHTRQRSVNSIIKNILLFPFILSKTIKSPFLKKSLLAFGDPICCPSVTFNIRELNLFRFDENYTCALDWLAWYQLSNQPGSFLYIRKKLLKHRIHAASETSAQIHNGKRAKEELQLFELIWGRAFARIIARLYTLGYRDNLHQL